MSALLLLTAFIPMFTATKYIVELNYGTHWAEMVIAEGGDLPAAKASPNRKFFHFMWPGINHEKIQSKTVDEMQNQYHNVYLEVKKDGTWQRYIYKGPMSDFTDSTPSEEWMLYSVQSGNGWNTAITHTIKTWQLHELNQILHAHNLRYHQHPDARKTRAQLDSAARTGYYDEYDADEQAGHSLYISQTGHHGHHYQHYSDYYEPHQYLSGNDGYESYDYGLSFAVILSIMGVCLLCIVFCNGCIMGGGIVYGVTNYCGKAKVSDKGDSKSKRERNRVDHYDEV